MRDIGETLKKLREQNGLTRREVAEKLLEYGIDISDKTLYGYESGRSSANADMFLALCKVYKCNNILSTFEEVNEDVLFTNQEWEHITKYRALDPPGKAAVDFILENETQRTQTIKILTAQTDQLRAELAGPKTLTRYFSYYGKIAAAGKSFGFDDIIAADVMELPITDLNHDADYLIGVSGDSMEPDYHDGDIVYVKKTDHLDIGEIGIFQKDNGIYIKEVGEIGLVSRNEKYKPIVNGGNVICLGRVIGKVEE